MSPFKQPRSPYYFIEYTDARGKRVRRSSKSKVLKVAEKMEDEERVRAEAARRGLMPATVNPKAWTLKQGAEWWCETIAPTLVRGDDTASVVKKHIVKGPLAFLPLEMVTPGEITTFLRELGETLSASSVNHVRAYLSGIYTRLRREGLFLGVNPVELTTPAVVEAAKPRTLPATYVLPLIEHGPTLGWRTAFAIAAYTGMREGEIAATFPSGTTEWPAVDLERRIITLTKTKRKNIRRIAIHTELVRILDEAKKHHVEMPTVSAYTKACSVLRNTLDRADIIDDEATFHGLRGAWVTHMVHSHGVSPDVVRYMKDGPDKRSVMETHYLQWPDRVLLETIDAMEPWPRAEVKPFARAKREAAE